MRDLANACGKVESMTNQKNGAAFKTESSNSPVAVVTGAGRGIGRATAAALRDKGCRVYNFSRSGGDLEGISHIKADVSDEAAFKAALERVVYEAGRLDILVNNAGFGISGAAEFTDNADAKRLLDVNLFGVVNGCKAAAPIMRAQGGGRIVNISSVAAPCAIPFQVWYSISKAAVSTYTAALANELRPFGISLTAVLPGDTGTGFTAAREKSSAGDDIYGGRIARSVALMERDEQGGMPANHAGLYIAKIALKKNVRPEYAIGLKYKFICFAVKLMPCGLRNRMIGMLYAK